MEFLVGGLLDDLFDFSSDIGDEEDDEDTTEKTRKTLPNFNLTNHDPASFHVLDPDDPNSFLTEFGEEELEWLSNKDAFPAVETFVDILPSQNCSNPKHHSPVSVLETLTNTIGGITSTGNHSGGRSSITTTNGSVTKPCCGGYHHLHFTVKAGRSKKSRKRRRDLTPGDNWCWWARKDVTNSSKTETVIGRKCLHCQSQKTPQWRAGPLGPKTLCNACGVRFKSGRLVAEYRPASSPTFSASVHSNSHRKIVEMRRRKYPGLLPGCPMDKG